MFQEYKRWCSNVLPDVQVANATIQIDITSLGLETLGKVLNLFDKKANAFRIDNKRMILFSSTNLYNCNALPFEMTGDQLAPGCLKWLGTLDYGPEPDHDGSNRKGWRCFNDAWGHIGHDHDAFAAIEPAWIMYGK